MRVEPYTVGSYLHVIKRGARGMKIVRDDADKWRFLRMLFLLNDKQFDKNWRKLKRSTEKQETPLFYRPEHWPPRETIVDIEAYTLMPNHFHLIIHEKLEGGVSQFMKRLGQSMTNHANDKYQEQGSLFQGAFRSRTIKDDRYLRYVAAYVMVKNTFELYPDGGLQAATTDFEKVWNWALSYSFSSLPDYAGRRVSSPILHNGLLKSVFTLAEFKTFSKDVLLGGKWKDKNIAFE